MRPKPKMLGTVEIGKKQKQKVKFEHCTILKRKISTSSVSIVSWFWVMDDVKVTTAGITIKTKMCIYVYN